MTIPHGWTADAPFADPPRLQRVLPILVGVAAWIATSYLLLLGVRAAFPHSFSARALVWWLLVGVNGEVLGRARAVFSYHAQRKRIAAQLRAADEGAALRARRRALELTARGSQN